MPIVTQKIRLAKEGIVSYQKPASTYLQRCYRSVRKRVIEMYGGCCNLCKEKELTILEIDHIKNVGSAKRETGRAYLSKLLKKPLDSNLQILCSSCNVKKYGNRLK